MAVTGMAIASLFAKIGADTGPFEKAMRAVEGDLKSAGKSFGGLQSVALGAFKAIGAAGVAAMAGLGATIVKSTNAAADMEQQMANLKALMGLTADQSAALQKHIDDLGLDPKLMVSATEAAQTVEMLAKNGLDLDQIMGGAARSAILLSNATGGDFAMSADLATDVMAIFGIEAANMDKAINGIVGTTKASKFSIDDYALALAQGGGVAASVGVSFEDFNATIAAISPLFASGSDAGTSFKTFLQRLVPTTDKAKELMQELGIITEDGSNAFFDAQGNMKSMSEVAGIMQRAFGGLSEEQKNMYMSTIFGTDAMRAGFALMEAGTETIDKYKEMIGATDAEEAAATKMDTLRGQMEVLSGIFESMAIQIGQKFLPYARRFVDWAVVMADRHGPSVVAMFGDIATFLENVITSSVAFGQNLASRFMPAIKGVFSFIANIPNVYSKFREIVDNVSDPGLARTVVQLRNAFAGLGKVLSALVSPFKNAFEGLFKSLMVARGGGWAGIFDVLISRLWGAVSQFGTILSQEAVPFLMSKLEELGTALSTWFTSVDWGTKLSGWVSAFIDWAGKIWEGEDGSGGLKARLNALWGHIKSWVDTPEERQAIWQKIKDTWDWFARWVGVIWEGADGSGGLKAGLNAIWGYIKGWVDTPEEREAIWQRIRDGWNWFARWAGVIWSGADGAGGIKGALGAIWGYLKSWVDTPEERQAIWQKIKDGWNWLTHWAGIIWEGEGGDGGIKGALTAIWGHIRGWVDTPEERQAIWQKIKDGWDWLTRWANAIWEGADGTGGLKGTLKAIWGHIKGWVDTPEERRAIWGKITSAWNWFVEWAGILWQGETGEGGIKAKLNTLWTDMRDWIDTNAPNLGTWIDAFIGFATEVETQWAISFPNMRTEFTNLRTTIETEAPLITAALGRLWDSMFGEGEGDAGGGFVRFLEGTFEVVSHTLGTIITQVRILLELIAVVNEASKAIMTGNFGQLEILADEYGVLLDEFGRVTGEQWQWFQDFMKDLPMPIGIEDQEYWVDPNTGNIYYPPPAWDGYGGYYDENGNWVSLRPDQFNSFLPIIGGGGNGNGGNSDTPPMGYGGAGGYYDEFGNWVSVPGMARGGRSTFGGLTWVGERGPELVKLPPGSHVFTNAQSMMMAGGSQHLTIDLNVHGESDLPTDRRKIRELAAALQRELQLTGARVVLA